MWKLRSRLKRATQWLTRNRAQTIGVLCVMLLVGVAMPVYAVDSASDLLVSATSTIFDVLLGFFVIILNVIGYAIGKLIVLMLGMVIIPILGYNGFADSNIIAIGWPLVRDVVNMFVIVILLVIAIRTIIGYKEANWQQQLPRLFIAIIAVNFSKTITLLVVDIGQVIMFTFVNALRDIAAGNFVNMFRLTEFFSYSVENIENLTQGKATAVPFESIGYLATSYVTVVFLIAVLAVLCLLAVVFIYRIIIIWVLTIMSPMAFFLGGIKSTVPRAGAPYSQWWEKLVGAVALGPILTFFLWLALAAAAEGSLASTEGFPLKGTEDIPALLSEVFQIDELLSLFIALVLIMAGFQAASQSASALGGFSGKMINEGTGKALVKNAAKLPASVAYRGARGAKAGGIELARQLEARTGVGSSIGKDIQTFGGRLEAEGGFLGRTAGRLARGAGGRLQRTADASTEAGRKAASEANDTKTRDERVNNLLDLSDDRFDANGQLRQEKFLSVSDIRQVEDGYKRVLTDKDERKKMRSQLEDRAKAQAKKEGRGTDQDYIDQLTEEAYGKQMERAIKWSEKNKDFLADKKSEVAKAKAGNLRFLDEAEIDAIISDPDFKRGDLSREDMASSKVLRALQSKVVGTERDKFGNEIEITLLDEISRGKGVGSDVRDAAQGKGMSLEDVHKGGVDRSASFGQAFRTGSLLVENLEARHLESRDAGGVMVKDPAKIKEMADAFAHAGVDVGDAINLPDTYKQDIRAELQSSIASATTPAEKARYQAALISMSESGDGSSVLGLTGPTGSVNAEQERVISRMLVDQPSSIHQLADQVSTGTGSTQMTRLIESNVDISTAEDIKNTFKVAKSNPALRRRLHESVRVIRQALDEEFDTAVQQIISEAATAGRDLSNGESDPVKRAAKIQSTAEKLVDSSLRSKVSRFRDLDRHTAPPPPTPGTP